MAPVEPWKKVLVAPEFLDTDHGDIACEDCHGGNPGAMTMDGAHKGIICDPTFPDATATCGDCHDDITEDAKNSLHYTLATFRPMVLKRASQNPQVVAKIDLAMNNHCYSCHSSCGQCHVSRPNAVEGGLVSGHQFSTPNMTEQCTACHGSRIGNEYLGKTGKGDVHFTKKQMECTACHDSGFHSDARQGLHNRYGVDTLPRCVTCHPLNEGDDGIEQHAVHAGKVQCQVCHSEKYANCSACHVGQDSKGFSYFKNPKTVETFKIGLNPQQSKDRPENWVLLRRVPANPNLFDYYVKDSLPNFNALPTWKYTTPHNIQRKTFRSRSCDNCHGNTKLFLMEKDVKFPDANRAVIVPEDKIPKRVEIAKKKKKRKKSYF